MMKSSIFAAALLSAAIPATAHASEVGGGIYPNGAEGISGAAVPPPGKYLLLYGQHYRADQFDDGDGRSGQIPGFRVRADAAAFRFVVVTKRKILGADFAFHVILPVVDLHVDAAGGSDTRTGIGDLTLTPIILGWHPGHGWHVTAALDVNAPIGTYDPRRLANIGRNYWNIEPVLAFAYYGRQGIRLDVKMMYDFNFTNRRGAVTPFNPTGADYRSGQEFHVDYALGYATGKAQFGVAGYVYHQTTGDRVANVAAQAGLDALGGFKGQAFALGPTARATLGKVQLIGTWQHEFSAEYRPRGDKIWLKAIIPL